MKVTEDCDKCAFKKAMANKKFQGKRISGRHGKCTRPEGLCETGLAEQKGDAPEQTGAEVTEPEFVPTGPLSKAEKKRRAELENVIQRNFKAFVETGKALAEIRDKRLYRSTHKTWETYCKDIWEMHHRYANRLIDSADVVENLGPMGPILPANERQARPLSRIDMPKQQQEVWRLVIEEANGKITANLVARMVRQYLNIEVQQRLGTLGERIAREEIVSESFKAGGAAFLKALDEERKGGWKHTKPEAALKYIDDFRQVVLMEI